MKNSNGPAYLVNNTSLHIFSESTNITAISFEICVNSDGSGNGNAITVKTSTGGVYATPSGAALTSATKNGSALASLANIQTIKANQTTVDEIAISFANPVKAIELEKYGGAHIRKIQLTYNSSVSYTTYYVAEIIGSSNDDGSVTTNPGGASVSFDHSTSSQATIGGKKYDKMEDNQVINLGSGHTFQVGDQIILDICSSGNNSSTGGIFDLTGDSDPTISVISSKTVAAKVAYVVVANDGIAGQQTATIGKVGTSSYIHGITVLRAAATGAYTITAATSTGTDTYGTVSAAASSADEDDEVVITASPAVGYRVASWAVSGTGASIDPTGSSHSLTTTLTMGTANATVTVTFEAIPSYTITYNRDGATESQLSNDTKYEDVDKPLSTSRYTKPGKWQVGWATSAGGSKVYDFGEDYTTNADLTLYPAWVDAETTNAFDYADAKSISQLEAAGWTFNSASFDGDPADTEAYANLVSAMNTAGLTTPKSNSMEDNAIAFAKNTGAYAQFDLGEAVDIYQLSVTLYGGSGSAFNDDIKFYAADGSTVKATVTKSLSAGNWKANSVTITYNTGLTDVRYIRVFGASKWVVMSAMTIIHEPLTVPVCVAPDHVNVDGNWHIFPGETLVLDATVYDDEDNELTEDVTYQWYKGGAAEGNKLEGETYAQLIKANVTFDDAGWYYCKATRCETTVTSSGFGVKMLRLKFWNGRGGGEYGVLDLSKTSSTIATGIIFLGAGWNYAYMVMDGCGNYFGNTGWMTNSNCTGWNFDQYDVADNTKWCAMTTTNGASYIFTVNYSNLGRPNVSVTYPITDQAAGKVIYFDNNVLKWTGSNLHYRIGHNRGWDTYDGYNNKTQMTLVSGTANLYKVTTVKWDGLAAWHIANNAGWSGNNNIYKTKTGDGFAITAATEFEGGAVQADVVTITPTTSHSTGGDAINNNCEFYKYTVQPGMKTDNIAIGSYENGTVTVAYTDVDGSSQSFTSGDRDLAHTVILTITATPSAGYQLASLTVNEAAHTSGNTYTATGVTQIEAAFEPAIYTITLNNQGAITAGTTSFDVTYLGTDYPAPITIPVKGSIAFLGYYTETSGGGVKVIDEDGSILSSVTGYTDASGNWIHVGDATLYAKWAPITVSLTASPATIPASTATNITFTVTTNAPTAGAEPPYYFAVYNVGPTDHGAGYMDGDHAISASLSTTVSQNLASGTHYTQAVIICGGAVVATSDPIAIVATTVYTLTYNGNGNTDGSVPAAPTNYASGAVVPAAGNTNSLEKDGYDFAGWNTQADGEGTDYAVGADVTMSSNITLYAKWVEKCDARSLVKTVLSSTTAGTTTGYSCKEYAGDPTIVAFQNTPTDGGYKLKSGSKLFVTLKKGNFVAGDVIRIVITVASDLTYTTGKLPVFYNASSPALLTTIDAASAGTYTYTLTAADITTLGSNKTIGVFRSSGETENNPYVKSVEVEGCRDWTTYSVTYDANGATSGSVPTDANEYICGTSVTAAGNTGSLTKTAYIFDGWNTEADGTGTAVAASGSFTISGNTTLYAQWAPVPYNITYHLNGGEWGGAAHQDTYTTFDGDYTLPIPTRAGYAFDGWYENSGLTGVQTITLEAGSVGDKEYWAKWGAAVTATWSVTKVDGELYRGGGGYSVTVYLNDGDWDASGDKDGLELTATEGVELSNIEKSINGEGKAQVTADFAITTDVPAPATEITFTLSVPSAGSYAAAELTHDEALSDCAGGGAVLFSQDFSSATGVAYAANTAHAYNASSTLSGLVGDGANLFTYLGNEAKSSCGIAVNSSTGGNSVDATGIFQAYNNNTGCDYALVYNTDFGMVAPTALKVNMKIWFNALSSGSDYSVSFAVGDGFSNAKSGVAAGNVHSGFSIKNNSSPEITAYRSTTKLYDLSKSTWHNLTWIINNTGIDLTYDNPNGGTSTVGNDKYDLWIGTTRVVEGQAASTASKDLQNLYIGDPNKKQHEFRLDDVVVTSLAGGGGIDTELEWETDLSGGVTKERGEADFTHTATASNNTLGAITYSSSKTGVATVDASGKVHIVGEGTTTITATLAASGCFSGATTSYEITVTNDCDDRAGTIGTIDRGCDGIEMTVTGHTAAVGVSYEWFRNGVAIPSSNSTTWTATEPGDYYIVVTNIGPRHCDLVSTNTVTVASRAGLTVENIIESWYVKNGRRTPDVELVRTTGATGFTVTNKGTSTVIWKSDGSVTTGFGGCGFYMSADGIIYLKGMQDDGTAPAGLTGSTDVVLVVTVADECGGGTTSADDITIHCQASTARPSIAYVVDGTKDGDWDAVTSGHASGTDLYDYLDYTQSGGAFDLTGQNIYATINEKDIREHYSQYDAILITDDPNTETKNGKISYVDAFGTMIDIRPMLTMEAFVSKLANWKAKGIAGTPDSPNPRQYELRLECKDHEIYSGLPTSSPGTHVWDETIDGDLYRHIIMVDSTLGIYNGVKWNEQTGGSEKPAMQGFSFSASGDLMGLGRILNGTLQAAIERQEVAAARLMVFGINAKALQPTCALTDEGKKVIANILTYLLKTNLEDVSDCSNFFVGTEDSDWSNKNNWTADKVPDFETKARILAPCVVPNGFIARVARVDIASSGTSTHKAACNGSLTISPQGALRVTGEIRSATAPHFGVGNLEPTTPAELVVQANSSYTGALVLDNSKGQTQATVEMWNPSHWEVVGNKKTKYWSYVGVPISDVHIPEYFYLGFTYLYEESSGWIKKGDGSVLQPFEGIGLSMQTGNKETFRGTLATTSDKDITLTNTGGGGEGQNLIGNSWTAPIQIGNFLTSDFDGATASVWVYNTGSHAEYDANGGSEYTAADGNSGSTTAGQWLAIPIGVAKLAGYTGLKVVPAMQAFEVNTSSTATLHLDYNRLVRTGTTQLNAPMRAPRRQAAAQEIEAMLRVRVAGQKTHTDVYLLQDEQFDYGFDNGWEAEYMAGDDRSAQLYALSETGQMAFLAQPDIDGTLLGFAPSRDGNEYTFSFYYTGSETLYLNDLKQQTSTPVNEQNTYTFTYEEGDAQRFMISATPFAAPGTATDNGDVASGERTKVRKVIYKDHVYIIRGGQIYDVVGKVVR